MLNILKCDNWVWENCSRFTWFNLHHFWIIIHV